MTSQIFLIHPQTALLKAVDFDSLATDKPMQGIAGMVAEGRADLHILPNGDRLYCAKGALNPAKDDEKANTYREFGGEFAVKAKPYEDGDDTGFNAGEGITEIVGPAVIVGPAIEGSPNDFTPATAEDDYYRRLVGFTPEAMHLAALLETLGSQITADNDDVDRADVTDEMLAECGCSGCEKELEFRKAEAAGGSRAVN